MIKLVENIRGGCRGNCTDPGEYYQRRKIAERLKKIKELNEDAIDWEIEKDQGQREKGRLIQQVIGNSHTQKTGSSEEKREVNLNSLSKENRNFLGIMIGGKLFKALYVTGATHIIVGDAVIEHTKNRLKQSRASMANANGEYMKVAGELDLQVDADGIIKKMNVIVAYNLEYDMYLGKDFVQAFKFKEDDEIKSWKIGKNGKWRKFLNEQKEVSTDDYVYAEYAGILISKNNQKEALEKLTTKYLTSKKERLGTTSMTQHVIDVGDAKPIKQKLRRMLPALQEIARKQIEEMLKE